MQLTQRDMEIIKFINEFGFCEMDQIQKRFNLNKPRNYEIMRRLIQNGLVKHKRIFFGRHGVYYLSGKGAKHTDLPPVDHIYVGQYEHHLAIMKIHLQLKKQYPEAHWISERRLKYEKFYDGVGKKGHLPDGMLLLPENKRVAIEVEMSVKGKQRIEKILQDYSADFSVDEVWYFCAKPVMNTVVSAAERMSFVKVFKLEEGLKYE